MDAPVLSTTAIAFVKAVMDAAYGMPNRTTAYFSGEGLTAEEFRLAHVEIREAADHLIVFSDADTLTMAVTKDRR